MEDFAGDFPGGSKNKNPREISSAKSQPQKMGSHAEKQKTAGYTQKTKKTEVLVSGAEIQTLAVDTQAAFGCPPLGKSV